MNPVAAHDRCTPQTTTYITGEFCEGDVSMPTYLLDLLDGTGRVERSVELSCFDDGEALLRAAALGHPNAVIVRCELRRVGDVRDGIIVPRVQIAD